MKKMNIRKTMIAVLATAMCATGAVIPTSADNVSVCSVGHTWYHASHGSYVDHGQDGTYCYNISYYQCVYKCLHTGCTASIMQNHDDKQEHSPIYADSASGLVRKCADCGYVF